MLSNNNNNDNDNNNNNNNDNLSTDRTIQNNRYVW